MNITCIKVLDDFYQRHCNGEWEHSYGVTIATCDNPGWWLKLRDPGFYKNFISGDLDSFIKKTSDEYGVIISYKSEQESNNQSISIFGTSLESILDGAAALISHVDKGNG